MAMKDDQITMFLDGLRAVQRERDDLWDRLMNPPTVLAPVPIPATAPERRPTSVIDDVIRLEAKDDMRLTKYLRKRAKVLRGEHPQWTDGQIATELSRWETAEEMPPEFIMAGGTE